VSLADETVEDVVVSLELLLPHVDGLELNASCPNVSWGRDRDQETHLGELVEVLRARTPKPVFVKLPPFATATERDVVLALAGISRASGADGLVVGNTRPVQDPRLAAGSGGLSGRALWARTADSVAEVVREAGGTVVACGGIFDAEDARTCLDAGAVALQIYTAFVLRGPVVIGEITAGLLSVSGRAAPSTSPVRTPGRRP
jgi:dihydroorotate dehydrogenase